MKTNNVKWSDKHFAQLRAINLELTAHCNYKCTFCMNHQDCFRDKGNISNVLIDKVINELSEEMNIHICGIGEPSLHPEFISILDRLSKKFANISIVTNGYLFRNSELINAVHKAKIKKINLSLDYLDAETYTKQKGGNLGKIIGYIKDFIEIRKENSFKPLLQVNYLYEHTKEKADYLKVITLLKQIMDDPWCLFIRKIMNLAGQVSVDEVRDEDLLDDLLTDYISDHIIVENWNRYLKDTNLKTENPKICRHIYDYYMLLWNGDVVPCCIDFNATMVICNVLSDNKNLNELFYSDQYKSFRDKMESLDYTDFPLCPKCNDYYKA